MNLKKQRRILAVILLALSLPPIAAQSAYAGSVPAAVTRWLDAKAYEGADKEYRPGELFIPWDAIKAIESMGINWLTVVRNEIFARHGYVFKTPILSAIFSTARWYRPDPSVGINALTPLEVKNVNWLKALEDKDDYETVAAFLGPKGNDARTSILSDESLALPLGVELALNHLYINPARLFRNVVFARRGYVFSDPVLKKLFAMVPWYKPVSADQEDIAASFNSIEWGNLELLRQREWVDIVNAVKISLPSDIVSIPVIGYNALYIKTLRFGEDEYHFSWADAWTAMEEKGKGLDGHVTDADALVDAATIAAINAERTPIGKLILFFNSKKYAGYADAIQFNSSDFVVPSYLASAVRQLDLDWLMLLRKEIHARNGAKFIDPKLGPVFRGCSWYKPRHELTVRTVSRFPAGAAIKAQELRNYSLLEGEELYRRRAEILLRFGSSGGGYLPEGDIACDLQGNFYFVKTGPISLTDSRGETSVITVGYGYQSERAFNTESLETTIRGLLESYEFYRENYQYIEETYGGYGC